MPAEWKKHEAIWLCWPHDSTDFYSRFDKVHKTYLRIIKTVSKSEKVNLLVKDNRSKKEIEYLLKKETIDTRQITFHIFPFADIWMRDYGPIFIVNQKKNKLAMTDWIFNAWGKKFKQLLSDTNIPGLINKKLNIPCFTPGMVLEGGSIDGNGKGSIITTEQCLLNKNRNSNLCKQEIEKYLMEYLGVRKIIWLEKGIAGDDTDGHVDNIARFVNPTTIVCSYEDDKNDENYIILKNNFEILQNSSDQDGNRLNIVKLPMPGFISTGKNRLPASYANFYIGNNVVLVPVFGCENDRKALDIIGNYFPTRKTIGIHCLDLLYGGGAIHCISQQQPAILCEPKNKLIPPRAKKKKCPDLPVKLNMGVAKNLLRQERGGKDAKIAKNKITTEIH